MKDDLSIIKASGEVVNFSEGKLRSSLRHAGATEEQVDVVIEKISDKLYPGISTKKIYRLAFNLLKGSSRHLAAKYHLKAAIMELGPSGFPFEKYMGEVLRCQGYQVKVGEIVQGHCVQHEIDIIANINHQQLLIECKYHNVRGKICDVKIPLYIQSRFKDVESEWLKSPGSENKSYQAWVATNTRFSDDAIKYGTCAGLKLVSWDYPTSGSLKDQIDALALYPVTCLTSLTKREKRYLMDRNIVLCQELCNNPQLLEQIRISESRVDRILQEAQQLCKHPGNSGKSL